VASAAQVARGRGACDACCACAAQDSFLQQKLAFRTEHLADLVAKVRPSPLVEP
jgi:hypothetical protein